LERDAAIELMPVRGDDPSSGPPSAQATATARLALLGLSAMALAGARCLPQDARYGPGVGLLTRWVGPGPGWGGMGRAGRRFNHRPRGRSVQLATSHVDAGVSSRCPFHRPLPWPERQRTQRAYPGLDRARCMAESLRRACQRIATSGRRISTWAANGEEDSLTTHASSPLAKSRFLAPHCRSSPAARRHGRTRRRHRECDLPTR